MTPLPSLRAYVQASHDLVVRAVPGKLIICDHNEALMRSGRFIGHLGVPPRSHERWAAMPVTSPRHLSLG